MKLIPEWRNAWRMYSVQALAAVAMLPLVWAEVPIEVKAMIPADWNRYILAAIAVSGMIGRLLDQRT